MVNVQRVDVNDTTFKSKQSTKGSIDVECRSGRFHIQSNKKSRHERKSLSKNVFGPNCPKMKMRQHLSTFECHKFSMLSGFEIKVIHYSRTKELTMSIRGIGEVFEETWLLSLLSWQLSWQLTDVITPRIQKKSSNAFKIIGDA